MRSAYAPPRRLGGAGAYQKENCSSYGLLALFHGFYLLQIVEHH